MNQLQFNCGSIRFNLVKLDYGSIGIKPTRFSVQHIELVSWVQF